MLYKHDALDDCVTVNDLQWSGSNLQTDSVPFLVLFTYFSHLFFNIYLLYIVLLLLCVCVCVC